MHEKRQILQHAPTTLRVCVGGGGGVVGVRGGVKQRGGGGSKGVYRYSSMFQGPYYVCGG